MIVISARSRFAAEYSVAVTLSASLILIFKVALMKFTNQTVANDDLCAGNPSVTNHVLTFHRTRMAMPLKISGRAAASLDHQLKIIDVTNELDRLSAALILIHLRSHWYTVRPTQWRVRSDPSH